MFSLTVIIPTYRRPKDLNRCLEALKRQTRIADEVLVVVSEKDNETWAFMETFNPGLLTLRTVTVCVPGVVAALNLGLEAAQSEIISITDDDAEPHADWLQRIETHFLSDSRVGGIGGRDWVYLGTNLLDGACEIVGKVQWFGRIIGNHHIGVGQPREVDVLKGVNMSFRRCAITSLRCDERLKGTGAQVHFEVALSSSVKKRGWKLIYDPAVAVNHYPAQRFDEDQRNQFNNVAYMNAVHNETLVLLEHLSPLRSFVFLLWAVLIGTSASVGLLQCLRFLPREGMLAIEKYLAALQGRWQGWQTWRQSRLDISPTSSNSSISY